MRICLHLLRRHALLYSLYWSVMFAVLAGFLTSFEVFGHWIVQTEYASAWLLAVNAAPGWFVFVMGIVVATVHLPIGIANGVTRRDYCAGAALFAIATCVLFELAKVVGLLVEALAYNINGIMDEVTVPYPWPTVDSTLAGILGSLGFMLTGWLIALVFYRLRIWWALVLAPLASLPLSGNGMKYTSIQVHWSVVLAVVAVWAVAGYLAARGVALKPKKS